MKSIVRKSLVGVFLLFVSLTLMSQVPSMFNYQAVFRDASGNIIADQSLQLKINILDGSNSNASVYSETHAVTTNKFGLVNVQIGNGTSPTGSIEDILWSQGNFSLKVEYSQDAGSTFDELGVAQLVAVPFALHAENASNAYWQKESNKVFINEGNIGIGTNLPTGKLQVNGDATTAEEDLLFSVVNNAGDTVFAVFQGGVRIYVDDNVTKAVGNKGGFAVGGFSSGKGLTNEFLRVTPDSVRIYIDDDAAKATGNKGGFAVGGFNSGKADPVSLMHITEDNYFIGHSAGGNNEEGIYNTFFGYESGYSNTNGSGNVFIGFESGFSNDIGEENVFIGNEAGYTNTEGYSNVYIGNASGYSSDTAVYNVFLGNYTGYNNTYGSSNVFIGDAAGEDNTTGSDNIFIGDWTGKSNTAGESNVFLGSEAGWSTLTGSYNVFLGTSSGYSNTIGEGNVFLGDESGSNNINGNWNVFLGEESGWSNTEGDDNVFLGNMSGYENLSGNSNVYLGAGAGAENVTGSDNVFIGTEAGYYETGSEKLYISNWDSDSTETLIFGNFYDEIVQVNNSLGVGRYPENNALEVEGDILATGSVTPDYVFEEYYHGKNRFNKEYKFLSLKSIEKHIKEKGHLPGVTSSEETKKQGGIKVNKVPYENLEKIEELYLHMIELEKRVEELERENKRLRKRSK
jgi:trimeric autotransporter adhesin